MEDIFVKQIAVYKSTNSKMLLNICSNLPKCGQTCTRGTGTSNSGVGGGAKAGGKCKSVADRYTQQSTLSGDGNGDSNCDSDVDGDTDGYIDDDSGDGKRK